MMEHKCRAIVKYNGQHYFSDDWIEGYYAYKELEQKHIILVERAETQRYASYFVEIEVVEKTVGRFTSFKDCKDTDIFQGDMLSFSVFDSSDNAKDYYGEVRFVNGSFILYATLIDMSHVEEEFELFWVLNQYNKCEIVGNIHDGV